MNRRTADLILGTLQRIESRLDAQSTRIDTIIDTLAVLHGDVITLRTDFQHHRHDDDGNVVI